MVWMKRQHIVLLADDVLLELVIERTFLQRSGFTVLTANDGPTAIELARAERPDLIILDQVMPGMSGLDVCHELKKHEATRKIPVIITSAGTTPDMEAACQAAGAEAFIPKSEGREALTKCAARILQVPERRSARITAFFSLQGEVGGKETIGRAIDISENGMSLETSRRYEVGDVLSLRFLLPRERREHQCRAKVIRVKERPDKTHLLGLEFTTMSTDDRRLLNEHLDKAFSVR